MIREFLAYRYQGVWRIDEILKKPKDIGWKCRKYIKWRDVHNSNTDAKTLYSFADHLIEKNKLLMNLYGDISGIFFNVQKWRRDKDNMAIDPPPKKEWEKREILFKAVQKNLALIPARLADQKLKIEDLDNLSEQILFYSSELDSLFQAQNVDSYPIEPLSKILLAAKEAQWGKKILTRFEYAYSSVGLPIPDFRDISQFIKQVLDDLGFIGINLDQNLTIPDYIGAQEKDVLVEIVQLEKFKLFEVSSACDITKICLNKKHPFIKSILINEKNIQPNMEIFLKSYAKCMLKMGGSLDTLETFNSYLGIDLHSTNT